MNETRGLLLFIGSGLATISYILVPRLWTIEGLSAVGTAAAAVIALLLGLKTQRDTDLARQESKDAERQRAVITAAGIAIPLSAAAEQGNLLQAAIRPDSYRGMSPTWERQAQADEFEAMQEFCRSSIFETITPEEIGWLAPLPGNCAIFLSAGVRMVRETRIDVMALAESGTWGELHDIDRQIHLKGWAWQILDAATLLHAAAEICKSESKIIEVRPSDDTLPEITITPR